MNIHVSQITFLTLEIPRGSFRVMWRQLELRPGAFNAMGKFRVCVVQFIHELFLFSPGSLLSGTRCRRPDLLNEFHTELDKSILRII